MDRREGLQRNYDRVTPEYEARFFDEPAHKPLDRALLDYFADQAPESGKPEPTHSAPRGREEHEEQD